MAQDECHDDRCRSASDHAPRNSAREPERCLKPHSKDAGNLYEEQGDPDQYQECGQRSIIFAPAHTCPPKIGQWLQRNSSRRVSHQPRLGPLQNSHDLPNRRSVRGHPGFFNAIQGFRADTGTAGELSLGKSSSPAAPDELSREDGAACFHRRVGAVRRLRRE